MLRFRFVVHVTELSLVDGEEKSRLFDGKEAITSKIKHAIKHKQVMQDLHNCCATVAAIISILF